MNNDYITVGALTRYIKYKLDTDNNLNKVYLKGEILTKLPQSKITLPSTLDRSFGINKEYNLNSNSVFINLTDNPIIFNKCFSGVVINDIEITINNDFIFYIEEFLGSINIKNLLEIMCNNNAVEMAGNMLKKHSGKITALVGIRGKLPDCEFCMKTLDKQTKLI